MTAGVGHVVLVGLMGVGKSSIGEILAAQLGLRFADTDVQIEEQTGRTVRELWNDDGEGAYRALEREAVLSSLAAPDPSVLAAPGGVIEDEVACEALRAADVSVVYLRAEPATLVERVGGDPGHRPLMDDDPAAVLTRQFTQRDGRYEALSDLTVQVDGLGADEVAEIVLAGL